MLTILIGLGVLAVLIGVFVTQSKRTKELPTSAPEPKSAKQTKPEKKDAPAVAEKSAEAARPLEDVKLSGRPTEPAEAKVERVPAARVLSQAEVKGYRKGLEPTRKGFIAKLASLLSGSKEIDPSLVTELEEAMIASDVGMRTTGRILERVKEGLAKKELANSDAVYRRVREEALKILTHPELPERTVKPEVILLVGVNGVGKTTTIGKLATKATQDGKKVLLAAGDTFRAAAVAQLEVWGKRVGAEVVRGKDGADPGSVAFDATTRASEAKVDLLFIDTAGRLHTKAPLMDEIKKVRKTIAKAMEGAPHETWLVVDATTGQNAIQQATLFKEAVDLTGVVLTKLDGTAKGGIVLAIADELGLPVRYVGLGERAEDLRVFRAEEFVEALFGGETDETAAA